MYDWMVFGTGWAAELLVVFLQVIDRSLCDVGVHGPLKATRTDFSTDSDNHDILSMSYLRSPGECRSSGLNQMAPLLEKSLPPRHIGRLCDWKCLHRPS